MIKRKLKECGGDCSCSCSDKHNAEEDLLPTEQAALEDNPPLEFDYKSLEETPYISIFQ